MSDASVTATGSILVVEDNPDLNMAICEILQSYGFEIASAGNGFEALEVLEHHRPDAILCDIMMPGMDGYTLLQHARADRELRTIPFIFLTARTSTEDQRRAKGIGIEDYLTKPVDEGHLVTAIQNALRRRQIMSEEMQRQMDALRNQIVGLLQHEFRTPLTFVLGYAEYLLDSTNYEVDVEDLRASASAILEGGRRLQRLIESFLLLADLQQRKLAVDSISETTASNLWREIAQDFRTMLSENQLAVEVLPQHDELRISGDLDLIREALRRLFDNAVRYKRPDSQHIWLSIEQEASWVGLRIRDESAGIPPDLLELFSRPFEQVDRGNRTQPGAGLSLALVHHIARLHGGSVEMESEVGEGTVITIWLPVILNTPAE